MTLRIMKIIEECRSYVDLDDVVQELLASATDEQITAAVAKRKRCAKNLCTVCGIDIGECNPRQLCRKTYCEN